MHASADAAAPAGLEGSGAAREFRSGWRILVGATVGIAVGLPTLPFYSIGVFAPALARTYHWSTGAILAGLAFVTVALFALGPLAGRLIDRQGSRRIGAASLVLLSLSFMSLSLGAGSLPLYYLSWALIAVTGLGATPVTFTREISAAFRVRRGLALGVALAGSGLFVFFVKPFAQAVLAHYGWRIAVVAVGLLPLAGVPVVLWGLPRHPARPGLPGAGDAGRLKAPGLTLAQALRTPTFWLLALVFTAASFASAGPIPNMETILRSAHLEPVEVIRLTSLLGISVVAGRLASGGLIDHFPAPLVGAVLLLGAALACLILGGSSVTIGRASLAIVGLGLAAGVEIDLMSYLVARWFGVRHYGQIHGLLYGVFAVGAGFGPGLIGYAYDRSHSYAPVMACCAGALGIAAMLLILLSIMLARLPA